MDIAEIRKKAKAQGKADSSTAEVKDVSVTEPRKGAPETVQAPTPVAAEAERPLAVIDEQTNPSHQNETGLDRLFAITEEFVLATDASYTDILEGQSSQTQVSQYLAFHLGDEEYALDIKRISEIIKVREFTDIPRSPAFILGIISLRGVVVPVFDLRQRLNLGAAEFSAASRIVVCQLEDVTCGLLVDSINQVVNLADDSLEPPPGVLSGLDRDMIAGVGRYQGRMIILLNLYSVLDIAFN